MNFIVAMDYIKALEEERKKILVFEREFPLTLQLVSQAIDTYKSQQKHSMEDNRNQQNLEICNEAVETSKENCSGHQRPTLEEFLSLRPSCSPSNEEINLSNGQKKDDCDKKPDWLKSVQLWNQQSETKEDVVTKPVAVSAKQGGGAFRPFDKENAICSVKSPMVVSEVPTSSASKTANEGVGCGNGSSWEEKKEKEMLSQRKTRRCWSPELHRRFLQALQQLGGPHVATPKQIREHMKVDGLTNDEVKSHLQKYRLHARRPSTATDDGSGNISPRQTHIVLVSGLWVPPREYPADGGHKQQRKRKADRSPTGPLHSEEGCEGVDHSEEGAEKKISPGTSAASSSSSQTTAVLPSF